MIDLVSFRFLTSLAVGNGSRLAAHGSRLCARVLSMMMTLAEIRPKAHPVTSSYQASGVVTNGKPRPSSKPSGLGNTHHLFDVGFEFASPA